MIGDGAVSGLKSPPFLAQPPPGHTHLAQSHWAELPLCTWSCFLQRTEIFEGRAGSKRCISNTSKLSACTWGANMTGGPFCFLIQFKLEH